jgi:hypothetical protein
MGETLRRRVEIAANVSLIAVAVLGCAVLAKQLLSHQQPHLPSPAPTASAARTQRPTSVPTVGARLTLPGVEWTQRERTLVLVLSTNCHYCTDSAPFYRRLSTEVRRVGKIGVVAVLPQATPEASQFLAQMGVQVDTVLQAPLEAVGTRGTPTLMLVDRGGVVKNTWLGRLQANGEAEVFDSLGLHPSE